MFVAGRMVLRLFVESHGTLVAVSALFVMSLRDSDIPMNVPITFRKKTTFSPDWIRSIVLQGYAAAIKEYDDDSFQALDARVRE